MDGLCNFTPHDLCFYVRDDTSGEIGYIDGKPQCVRKVYTLPSIGNMRVIERAVPIRHITIPDSKDTVPVSIRQLRGEEDITFLDEAKSKYIVVSRLVADSCSDKLLKAGVEGIFYVDAGPKGAVRAPNGRMIGVLGLIKV